MERENALDHGIAELRSSGSALERKEIEVISAAKALENKALTLRSTEDEAIARRLKSTSNNYERSTDRELAPQKRAVSNLWLYDQRENVGNDLGTELPLSPNNSQSAGPHIAVNRPITVQYLSENERQIERELKNIRRSIQISKQKTSVRNMYHF